MNKNWFQFWQLLEPEHPRAHAFCRKLAGGSDDGDDLYQDALVRALPAFEGLRDHAAFRAWLYRIIVNLYRSRCKRSFRQRFTPLTSRLAERANGDNPAGRLTARRRLEFAFEALSPADKALVTLKELEGWTIAELAEMTGRSAGSIKVRLSRARAAMRKRLAGALNGRPIPEQSEIVHDEDGICVVTKHGRK